MAHALEDDDVPAEVQLAPFLSFWDPFSYKHEEPSAQCLSRIRRDIADIIKRPIQGVLIAPEENDYTTIHALVVGPADTPYEGGFFHFLTKCTAEYPTKPPRVRLMTTDGGWVRFGPNLNEDGMVCLSILGTWPGQHGWCSDHNLRTVLTAIQSLMTQDPYYNEPRLVRRRDPCEVFGYNAFLRHETIRVAFCDAVESCIDGSSLYPPAIKDAIITSFPQLYDKHVRTLKDLVNQSGTLMRDPFGHGSGRFNYEVLLTRLVSLYDEVMDTGASDSQRES
ncbi:hypothetical protein V5799_030281 [Amblyomma americanum]|uniref:Ubiquitin-conjugating enzyme E2 Z n=1 Tax=Amblyomma americanum TaxID=6943 RepID=A0AAQ4EPD8_AMBAM